MLQAVSGTSVLARLGGYVCAGLWQEGQVFAQSFPVSRTLACTCAVEQITSWRSVLRWCAVWRFPCGCCCNMQALRCAALHHTPYLHFGIVDDRLETFD